MRVGVVGGGVLGVSTAAHLARAGASVVLVSDGPLTSSASGRSLSWLNSSGERSDAYHRLRMAGIDRYRTLATHHPDADWLRFDGGVTWNAPGEGDALRATHAHERAIGYDSVLLTPEQVAALRAEVAEQYETQSDPYYATSRLWDDGLIDPVDTRDTLGLCLALAARQPEPAPGPGLVYRM